MSEYGCACRGVHMKSEDIVWELPTVWVLGIEHLGYQAWWQTSLPTEPSLWPFIVLRISLVNAFSYVDFQHMFGSRCVKISCHLSLTNLGFIPL